MFRRMVPLVVVAASLTTSGCGLANLVVPGTSSEPVDTPPLASTTSSRSVVASESGRSAASSVGVSATASPSRTGGAPSPSISVPQVSLTRPPAPKTPPAASGYTYEQPSSTVAKAFAAQDVGQALSAPLVKSVVRQGSKVGSVGVRQLAADQVGDPEIEQSLVAGVVKGLDGLGFTVRTRTVSDTPVVVAFRKGSTIATWYADGLLIQFVTSDEESTALNYAKAELAA